ncbi:MAG: type II toxin-antitoxin system HicA family toxin [Minisyncoccales bacterium]|jgi:predicted RNA binding protein YcfA (HicA-like mRNA interferase family)|nr:type II toxin-antitoxin system HicA family toxin [Candidatus Pacearchaeota archaeon]
MPKLKVISGKELIKIFGDFGFVINSQKGSHVKLKRIISNHQQALTIPNHSELDKGTLKAIFNQAAKYIPESDLRKHFYSQ